MLDTRIDKSRHYTIYSKHKEQQDRICVRATILDRSVDLKISHISIPNQGNESKWRGFIPLRLIDYLPQYGLSGTLIPCGRRKHPIQRHKSMYQRRNSGRNDKMVEEQVGGTRGSTVRRVCSVRSKTKVTCGLSTLDPHGR